jgi:hypothetical protein
MKVGLELSVQEQVSGWQQQQLRQASAHISVEVGIMICI